MVKRTASTWVIYCCWISDEEIDRGFPTTGSIDVKAYTREGALAALRRKLGKRLVEVIRVTEWKPGAFDSYVAKVTGHAAK